MKRIKFLVNAHDIYTGEKYFEGQEVEFKDKRADEILSKYRSNGKPYAELLETVKEVETATKKVKQKQQ